MHKDRQTYHIVEEMIGNGMLTLVTQHFYHTTHMHSVDYAVKRCLSVCMSVRPSHAGIVCNRLYISKFFSPSGSHTILFFSYKTGWQYFDGDPPNGGTKCKGV